MSKQFIDQDFLLKNETAKDLYHNYAAKMPVVDYHCHINPQEIAEDKKYSNIAQPWLAGDHYKWRQMRSNGVPEEKITGNASDREKFQAYAETLERAIGNPLYHWSHLELQRYFDCHTVLNGKTAEEVWTVCNQKLASMSVRSIIRMSNVKLICTTDDPADDLRWHKQLAMDSSCAVKVLPAWRPDKALNIEQAPFKEYIASLSAVSGVQIGCYESLCKALTTRLDFFGEMGCKASDHALDFAYFVPASDSEADAILKKALAGQPLSETEILQYKTQLMLFFARQYAARGWVMQLHYSAVRNVNSRYFEKLGPDTGFDCMGNPNDTASITRFLDALDRTDELPKTIFYSLNENDNQMLGTVIGCFQSPTARGKLQHGSAWWFNDTKSGMEKQLVSLANLSLLGNFIGMLTDSRSYLSYTRHEYFRRILCNLIGTWAEEGELPNDREYLGKLVQDISYNNAVSYFGFDI